LKEKRMIFVSGANGQFAGAVIRTILQAGRGASLVVGTRTADSPFARELAAQGVSVRHADFREPQLMRAALLGVDKALFIPTYDANDLRLRQNLNAIEAARDAGVRHLIYPSFLNAENPRVEHSRLVHFPTEQALRASGLGFTILRHSLYADILTGDLDETLSTGVLNRCGGAARCAFVARADLGISAAQVLMRDEPSGRVYSETMEQTYSGDEIAAVIAEVFGKPVRYQAIPSADWPQYMSRKWGLPPELSKSTLGTMQAIEAGEFDMVSPDYREITGRPARSLREFFESVRDARAKP
jgi:NAD(P)H dehydrogenase (quinone)